MPFVATTDMKAATLSISRISTAFGILILSVFLSMGSTMSWAVGSGFGVENRRSRPSESKTPLWGTFPQSGMSESSGSVSPAQSRQPNASSPLPGFGKTDTQSAVPHTVHRANPGFAAGIDGNDIDGYEADQSKAVEGQPVAEARRPHPSVARVIAFDKDGQQFGSGTLVGESGDYGIVLTNWHVVSNADGLVHVHFPGFGSYGAVIAADKKWDLAAIGISKPPRVVPKLPIARTVPQRGDPLWIVGYGAGVYRIAGGRCLRYLAPEIAPDGRGEFELIDLSVNAREGDSGGPILNESGQIAGVLFGSDYKNTVGSNCTKVRQFLEKTQPMFQTLQRNPEDLFQTIETGGPKRRLTDSVRMSLASSGAGPSAERYSQGPATSSVGSFGVPSDSSRRYLRTAEQSALYRQSPDTGHSSYIQQQSYSVPLDGHLPGMIVLREETVALPASPEADSARASHPRYDTRKRTTGWGFALLISSPLLVSLLRRVAKTA